MGSLYLAKLGADERKSLVGTLHQTQSGNCFICEESMLLAVHGANLDIDHVVPLHSEGKDDPSNFALTHASCNRSKQAANLEVARILHRFSRLKEHLESENRNPNLGDILRRATGGKSYELAFEHQDGALRYSFSDLGDNGLRQVPVYDDPLSGFKFAFAELPIEYLAHDDHVNPRTIGSNIGKLVEEFHRKRPQLHVPLAWIRTATGSSRVHVFDGQHKAAAQIMLGVKRLPVRIFLDPDADVLITANTNAGTTLKQVAFDKSVQRHLGSALYRDRLRRYQQELGKPEDDLSFSEKDLVKFFKGQSREIKKFILDNARNGITSDPDNKLRDYIELAGKGHDRPLSYSTIDKTFFSFFVYQEALDTPLNSKLEEGENPRHLEREQLVHLMNVIAEVLYIDKYDPEIGTDKIESKLQKGEHFPHEHLRAFRMSKEEILYIWLQYVGQVARQYFIMQGRPDPQDALFLQRFPDAIWTNIRRFVVNLSALPLWVNKDLSETAFGGKQNAAFWKAVFETGSTPQGLKVLAKPIHLIDMIRE